MPESTKELYTEEITLNMGPQHPSTHGVYRGILTMDGEYVVGVENVIGYLHRGLEKIAENRTYTQFIPYTDRLDYLSAMLNNLGYVQAVEKLMGIEVPERAEYLRIIMAELQRMASHMVFVASFALDLSGWTGWMYPFRDRERILDLFEMASGSRLTTSYLRIGGVAEDVPEEFWPALKALLADLPRCFEEYDGLITGNEIFQARTKGIGILDVATALAYGVTGPNLRAAGLAFDLRKARPYGIYSRFDFEIPTGQNGDSFDRFVVRIQEMRQSLRIIEQAVREIPAGPVRAKLPKVLRPPKGEVYHQIEGSKGILGFYLVSDGSTRPYRLHIRGPSFVNLGAFPLMVKGGTIQDLVSTLASIDIVLGEVDR
ncbi:MAG: NADH-quinone oxidoreductase subunit D [Clostridia bacterium]|nr:NADH-quinone oxidoreductase subunit D [Clostridia bacterium]